MIATFSGFGEMPMRWISSLASQLMRAEFIGLEFASRLTGSTIDRH
jgi:hypothetical protein